MTLEDVKNIVGLYYLEHMPKEIFETLYNDGEMKLFLVKYMKRDYQALRHFKKVIGDDTPPLAVTNGRADIPTDFMKVESAYYMKGAVPVDIEFVEDSTYDQRITHAIEFPDVDYPLGNVQEDYIRFRPKDAFKHAVLSYFTQPINCVYNTTESRGFIEFNATGSTTVKWDTDNVTLLIQNILQATGIIINQSEIKSKIEKK